MNETELARMVVRLMGDASSYLGMLKGAASATAQVTAAVERQSYQIDQYAGRLVRFAEEVKYAFLGALGVLGGFHVMMESLREAADVETLRVSFGVMLQDMRSGELLVKRIQNFAVQTPFTTPTLSNVTKQLLQMNAVNVNNIIPTLKMLGDVTGGSEDKLQHMAYAFGEVAAQGRLMGNQVQMMTYAGFNPLQEMHRTTGKGVDQLRDEVEKGLVTFDMLKHAFETATSKGGQFFNGMKLGSETLHGLWSTLRDNVIIAFQDLGDALVKGFDLKTGLKATIDFTGAVRERMLMVADAVHFVRQSFTDWYNTNQNVIRQGVVAAEVLLGVWAAVKLLGLAVGVVGFVLGVLRVEAVLSVAAWVAQRAAVLLVQAAVAGFAVTVLLFQGTWNAMVTAFKVGFAAVGFIGATVKAAAAVLGSIQFLYTVMYTVVMFLQAFATPAMAAYTLASLAATAATWLLNAAVGVLDVLLSPALVFGVVAAFAVLALTVLGLSYAFAAVYGAGVAVVGVVTGLFAVFSQLGESFVSGPVAQVAPMFRHWGSVLSDVTDAVQVDFALAWKFVVAYAKLAQEQIKDLWPPLSNALADALSAVWRYSASEFRLLFLGAYSTVLAEIGKRAAPTTAAKQRIQADIDAIQAGVAQGSVKNAAVLAGELEKVMKNFKVVEGEGVGKAAEAVANLQDELEEADFQKWVGQMKEYNEVLKGPAVGAQNLTAAVKQAHQAVERLSGALAGSNEGYQRLLEQREMLEGRNTGPNAVDPRTGRIAQTGSISLGKSERFLGIIAENTARTAAQPPMLVSPANV